MSEASHEITQHTTIGPVKGLRKTPDVIRYLGVQYATLEDRFSRGELLQSYPASHPDKQGGVLNATRIKPIPVSPENGCEWEQTLIQHPLPFGEYPQSDTECLTLNIAVPAFKPDTSLPVLVFVHGGAFATGSSSYPQNDLTRITQLGLEINKPMITVGVNYRLGVPGFLYSSAMKEAGYKPNNGLDDQRLALRWVKHHIAGFGGDPQRVTFMGESAGAASGCFHLHSTDPLFQQFISMSGTSLLRARSPEVLQSSFSRVTEIFGTNDLSPQEQVQHLLKVSIDELQAKVGRQVPLGPMVDGDMIHETTTFQALADRSAFERLFPGAAGGRCKRILVGDCQMDAAALAPRLWSRTDILPHTLVHCLLRVLKPTDTATAMAIIAAYGLDANSIANTQNSTERVLNFGNDVCFAVAAREFAGAWSLAGLEAFLYRFNCPNPWDGAWKGYATHILDLAFLLLNYNEYLSRGQQQCAQRFAEDVITFVQGGEPWPAATHRNGTQEGSMVYDAPAEGDLDRSEYVGCETPQMTGRRDIMLRIEEPGLLDRLMDGWQLFMAQK